MPHRILRYLATVETMAKTASHTMNLIRQTCLVVLLVSIIFAVFRVGNASYDHHSAAADTEREVAIAIREMREQIGTIHADTETGRETMIKAIESMKGLVR